MGWLAVLLVFVLVSGCVGSPPEVTTTTNPFQVTNPSECENESSISLMSICYRDMGVFLNDTTLCDKALNIIPEGDGYRGQANYHRELCYSDIAIETANPSICEKMENLGSQAWCYENTAIFLRDISLCDKVEEVYRENCIKGVTRELDKTKLRLAEEKNNSQICDSIEDQFVKDECFGSLASMLSDVGLCDRIIGNWSRDYCISHQKNDLSFCDNQTQTLLNTLCHISFVYKLNDTAICDKINTLNGTWKCYGEAAIAYKNLSLCEKMKDNDWKDNCYTSYRRAGI